MIQPEFDQHAAHYDRVLYASIPNGFNENGYFAEYKVAMMAARLGDVQPARILDFGCGSGRGLPYLKKYFPKTELWGYDISPASLKVASGHVPEARLVLDWSDIADMYFDAIIAANVFHHITPDQRQSALSQCRDALIAEGQMFLFEHNPYNPVTRWIFERCPFDSDAEMFDMKTAIKLSKNAGFRSEHHRYTLFFPRPLAFFRGIEPWLRKLPFGAQYFVQMSK